MAAEETVESDEQPAAERARAIMRKAAEDFMADTLSESGGIGNESGLMLTNCARFDKKREWRRGAERLTCLLALD
jgi:hypothetical protein